MNFRNCWLAQSTVDKFRARWLAHFGQAVHPIVEPLLAAASRLWEKPYEDTELCWAFLDGRLSVALAFELERDEDDRTIWHLMLPVGMPTALNLRAWQGFSEPGVAHFANEMASEEQPYCVLEVVFAPGGEPGMSLEFFFGGKPYDAEE